LLYAILIYTIETVILLNLKNKKDIESIAFITIGILGILCILNLIDHVIPLYIITIVQLMISIVSYINTKQENKKIFKYFIYVFSNLVLYSLLIDLNIGRNILYYIPTITTLSIMKLERVNKEFKDEGSNIYLGISQVVSFICLYNNLDNLNMIIALILASIFIIENIRNKETNLNIIPLICAIPFIFNNDFNCIVKNIIMLLSAIGLTTITVKEKKVSLYTMFSAIYMIFTIYNIQNVYFREVIFIIWSSINCYYIQDEKIKDLFKSLSYIGSLLLYNTIIHDMNIDSYTVINMMGYVVLSIVVLRTILNKYFEDINIIEYIIYAIIYTIAISQYNNELDGILFGALLILIVMISYIKKYGSLFFISIFAILVNVFILTRKFWFSIPWWGYLLAIGIILISFAIRNEVNDKKHS